MANDGQKEKIGDDIPSGSGKHADSNIEEENHNEGTRDQNPEKKDILEDGWLDEGNGKQVERLQSVVNFMMQNNVMQPPFPLKDTPIPVAKNNA
ncbi:hypothetical protein ACSBR2_008207 [Camellia fascicularis]